MHIFKVVLFTFISVVAFCQQPAFFPFAEKQFEGTDIYSLTQDNTGDYWFATDEGLFRHDGYLFYKIESDEMQSNSLFNFVRNSEGTIYCNSLNQQVFEIKNGKIKLIFVTPDTGNDCSLHIAANDNLIVGTGRYVYVLDKDYRIVQKSSDREGYISIVHTTPDGVTFFQRSGFGEMHFIDSHNRILTRKASIDLSRTSFRFFNMDQNTYGINLEDGSIFRVEEGATKFTLIAQIPEYDIKAALRVYPINNEVWIATSRGGVRRFCVENDFKVLPPIFYKDQLISHVFYDQEGNILLSTFDNGVIAIPNIHVNDVAPALVSYNVTRLEKGEKGLFIGTRTGEIIHFDGQVKQIESDGFKAIEAIRHPKGSPFLFSDRQGFSITHLPSGKTHSYIQGSFKDVVQTGKDTYLVALNVGAKEFVINETGSEIVEKRWLYEGRTYCVDLETVTGVTYISTREGLLFRGKNKRNELVLFRGKSVNATSIQALGDRTLVATRKFGLLLLQNGKVLKQIRPRVAGEAVSLSEFSYENGKIYANSTKGLIVFDLNGNLLQVINKSTGLSANKIIDFCILGKDLWVVHSAGVQNFNLENKLTNMTKPVVRLRGIFVNDIEYVGRDRTNRFNSDQRKLRFVLQVPTLRNRDNIVYHYRLVGLDDKWHTLPYENNEIVYNALGFGDYRLEVKAENNGMFSSLVTFDFKIKTPFYYNLWFIFGVSFAFVLSVYLIYRRQLAAQEAKARQINELNASRLTAIQSQMNPHFIFNSLNSIQDLVLKGDVDNSYSYITKFSNLVRRTLNYSEKDFIEFEQEVKLLELYLSLEKLRFRNELIYTIDSGGIEDVFIPPMLIQPFIENALVHGLLHKQGEKILQIKFFMNDEDILICEITDNGVGRRRAEEIKRRQRGEHESFALGAIKKRFSILEQHYKEQLGFEYHDLEEGTMVRLKLPVRRMY